MKRLIALMMMLVLLSGSALAAASVTYEGGAEDFVFLPGSAYSEEDKLKYSDSDLFENFKGVLPGDEITQKIKVKNSTKGQVRIYLRAEPVTEEDKAFLDQMTMTVECRNKEIFDARASETAGLTKNTLLGTFKKNGSTELEVTLHVPHEMDSTFMGKKGVVPWTFLVEEVPVDNTPDTGDWFQMTLWIGVAALLVAAITLLVILQHKRRKAE